MGRAAAGRTGATLSRFHHFAAVDWSGAVGPRQRGIAVAICEAGRRAPALVRPGHIWSRADVLAWLVDAMPSETLVGLDLGLSLPFVDAGAFFPGWADSPADARGLWALVERIAADDPHLAATSFVDHPDAAGHFRRHGGRPGQFFAGQGRLRETERAQRDAGFRPYSNLNLVGAAQVGKSSLTGMRVLHRLDGRIPIWPFDRLPSHGSALVEIYTTIAARAGDRPVGRSKMQSPVELAAALTAPAIDSDSLVGLERIDDHQADALLSAAWLRRTAEDEALWRPRGLTEAVRASEGWTFGIP